MIRIKVGRYRGQQLHCPKGKSVRPTTGFVRESLFNILGPSIVDCRLLDLYAGCGIVGIEALSRGAGFVQAVEKHSGHCTLLEKNKTHLKLDPAAYQITCQDVTAWLKAWTHHPLQPEPFDIVFLDPPYAMPDILPVITACFEHHIVSPSGQVIWETSSHYNDAIPDALSLTDRRNYGTSSLLFFQSASH